MPSVLTSNHATRMPKSTSSWQSNDSQTSLQQIAVPSFNIPAFKKPILLLLTTFFTPFSYAEEKEPESIQTQAMVYSGENNWMFGNLQSISSEGAVKWLHNGSGTIVDFPAGTVKSIYFSSRLPPPPHNDVVWMEGKSSIQGNITAMDDKELIIHTNFADNIHIPRKLIRGFQFNDGGEKIVFDQIGSLADWSTSSSTQPKEWQMTDNRTIVFNGNGSENIARDIGIPRIASIEFELSWKSSLNTTITLLRDPDDNDSRDYYVININNGHLFWQRASRTDGRNRQITIGRIHLNEYLKGRNSAHFRLSIDRTRKKVFIFMNGERISEWNDIADGVPTGGGFEIRGNNDNPLRIRNLVVREWNGRSIPLDFEQNSTIQIVDSIETSDDDLLLGKITGITLDDQGRRVVELSTPLTESGTISPPENFISQITLATNTNDEAIIHSPSDDHIRLLLEDGSILPASNVTSLENRLEFQLFNNPDSITIPLSQLLRIDFQVD